ncbi:hypothetical protein ABH995_000944 [Bradyrhizobium yuanmingense]|uniref:hypothetical protein n=1 Tax=Bradyrhizobium yuanmingense TaxID=108015 RepID=UPI003518CF87
MELLPKPAARANVEGAPLNSMFELTPAINDCRPIFGGTEMIVVGRRGNGVQGGRVKLSAFLPDWKMALTFRAKVFAAVRPLCHFIEVRFATEHSVARRFSRGVLDRPFDRKLQRRWSRSVRVREVEFLEYAPQVGSARSVRTLVLGSRRVVVYVINGVGAGGSFVARRVLNIPRRQAYHDVLISHGIDRADRTALNYTPAMLTAAVLMYRRLGVHLIYLTAGLSAGGRIWPKYGFRPVNSKEWWRCRKKILSNLNRMPPEIQRLREARIRALLDHPNPLNLRIIYQLNDQVPDIVEPTRFRNLGSVLLTGTRWHGVLDLSDVDSRRIFEDAVKMDLQWVGRG